MNTEKKEFVGYDKKFKKLNVDLIDCILLTNIEYLSSLPKGCFKSDKEFGEDVMIECRETINRRLKKLEAKNYIRIETNNIKGGKRRKIYFNSECLQVTPESIEDNQQVTPESIVQVTPESIDNRLASHNNIDINIDIEKIEKAGPSTGPDTSIIFKNDPVINNKKENINSGPESTSAALVHTGPDTSNGSKKENSNSILESTSAVLVHTGPDENISKLIREYRKHYASVSDAIKSVLPTDDYFSSIARAGKKDEIHQIIQRKFGPSVFKSTMIELYQKAFN